MSDDGSEEPLPTYDGTYLKCIEPGIRWDSSIVGRQSEAYADIPPFSFDLIVGKRTFGPMPTYKFILSCR